VRLGPDDPDAFTYGSVAAAVEAAEAGAVVTIAAGYYAGRLILSRPVTLAAADAEGKVVLEHSTVNPYEATLQVESPGCVLRGLTLRHASPSVASNNCVLVRGGAALTLERCALSSATGSGLGCEGGVVTARSCSLSGCRLHGAALYGDLGGESSGESTLEGCTMEGNGGHGVLLRDGVAAALRNCVVEKNGLFGVEAVDSTLTLVGCTVRSNRRGAVRLERGRGYDAEANALDGALFVTDQIAENAWRARGAGL